MGLFSKKSAPQPSARPEYIEVGQIVNTHGVRGEVKVQPWDVSPELLCGFKTFYMDGAPFRPTSKRVQGDMVLMKLPEVDDMDAAAALRRKVLSIRRNDVQLKPGEHFDAEIKIDAERAQEWIKTGAQPTDTVRALLKKVNAL